MKRNEKEIILNEEFAGKLPGESFITSCAIASSLVRRGVGTYKVEGESVVTDIELENVVLQDVTLEEVQTEPTTEQTEEVSPIESEILEANAEIIEETTEVEPINPPKPKKSHK